MYLFQETAMAIELKIVSMTRTWRRSRTVMISFVNDDSYNHVFIYLYILILFLIFYILYILYIRSQIITGNTNVSCNEYHWNLLLSIIWYFGRVKTFVGDDNLNSISRILLFLSRKKHSNPKLAIESACPRLRQRHESTHPSCRKHLKTEIFRGAILFAPIYRVTPFHLFNLAPKIIYIRQDEKDGLAQ